MNKNYILFTLSIIFLPYFHLSAQSCADWGNFKISQKEGNSLNIWWTNNEERRTFAYEIESNYEGKKFEQIGTLTGLQNYVGITPYIFEHDKPFLGTNYYRIKRIMTNQDTCYSPILTFFLNANGIQAAEMYPNPAQEYLKISFFSTRYDTVRLTLYNMQGEVAIQEQLRTDKGKNVLYYSVENIENGVYSVELKNREVAVRKRIMVLH